MALADYRLCDVCEAKTFYDANLNYDFEDFPTTGLRNLGAWAVLCPTCAETHEVIIRKKDAATNQGGHQNG